MKSQSRYNSTKKGFIIVFFRDVMTFHAVPLIPPPPLCFRSREITKSVETHQPPMRDVTIEQPLRGVL